MQATKINAMLRWRISNGDRNASNQYFENKQKHQVVKSQASARPGKMTLRCRLVICRLQTRERLPEMTKLLTGRELLHLRTLRRTLHSKEDDKIANAKGGNLF